MPDELTTIFSTKHSMNDANIGKLEHLNMFREEYCRVAGVIIDEMWNNGYFWFDKEKDTHHCFYPKLSFYSVPHFIDYNKFKLDTFLTARTLTHVVCQVAGMLNSAVEKQKCRIYMLEKQKSEGRSRSKLKKLIEKIKTNIPQKPNHKNINPELSSKCIRFEFKHDKHFDGFLVLSALFKYKDEKYESLNLPKQLNIPINFHGYSKKLNGSLMTSFMILKDEAVLRWQCKINKQKIEGIIVGADQGLKTVLTLSDGQTTPQKNKDDYSLQDILDVMCRKKKGSKNFKRCQDHRKNFINWSINRLDLTNIKQINLEEIKHITYKNKTTQLLSHWTNTLIQLKVERDCMLSGVTLKLQGSTYRSQRCSCCGLVRKANRKGKIYTCINCGNIIDADYNASKNHEQDIPEIPYSLRKLNLNRGKGFLWLDTGFYDFVTGASLESAPPK